MDSAYRKVCVVGPGSIGGMLAVRLALAGFETCALARPERAERINANGITLRAAEGTVTERIRASDDPHVLGPQDAVFIAVKYNNLREIAAQLLPLCGPNTPLVFMLNGVPWWFLDGMPQGGGRLMSLDPDGYLEQTIPLDRVIWSTVEVGAAELPDGTIQHKLANILVVGRADGSVRDVPEIADLLRRAGYDVEETQQIRDAIWSKLKVNMAVNPLSALTLSDTGNMMADPIVQELLMSLLAEAGALGAALGLAPGVDYGARLRENAPKMMNGPPSSMGQDMLRGRPLELDPILWAPVEIAERLGVPMPYARMVLGLIRTRVKAPALRR